MRHIFPNPLHKFGILHVSVLLVCNIFIPAQVNAGSFCSAITNLTSCVDTFDDGSGANNYENNTNCQWLIQPAGASSITLNFISFAVEDTFDEVCIYDGITELSPLIACFSGNAIPSSVSSSSGNMLVVFNTDFIETRAGWSAAYYCQTGSFCPPNSVLSSCNDGFNDGSGPGFYLNNTDCQWLIQPAGATSITLNFTSFDTEEFYDEVCVYDGSTNLSPLLGCFSGSFVPASVASSGGSMLVVFTSDSSITASGWSATYTCQTGQLCNGTTTLTSCSGGFSDGSDTSNYLDNADCRWLIQPSGATSITLGFTSFDTEEIYDGVCVYDGSTDLSPLLGCFSGDSLPSQVSSSGGSMLVVFTSDISINAAGWSATYNCQTGQYCNGITNLTDCSGNFNDGSGAGNYLNNSNCHWLIQPPGALSISLNFTSFNTEEYYDEVCIYDGNTDTFPLLGCFSGDSIPLQTASSGGSMLVVFTSDSTITSQGWSAAYACQTQLTVSGFMKTESNAAIPKVSVLMDGTNTGTDTTSGNGEYVFLVSPNDSISITPSKNNDIATNNGITTLDIILMQRQILAIQSLSSPYKIIAADVNGSYGVTTLDIVLTRSVILQNNTSFPNGMLWRFVPEDFVFANPANPFPFDNSRNYSNITGNQFNQNFIGIKLGDVNNSWDMNVPKTGHVEEVGFMLGEFTINPGEEIAVPVKVKDFENITGYQFTISWDPEVIELVDVINRSLNGYFGAQSGSEGYLLTSWNDELSDAITLIDSEVAFEIKYKAIGGNGAFSEITIGSELIPGEAYNGNLDMVQIVTQQGLVKVGDSSSIVNHTSSIHNVSVQPNPFHNNTTVTFQISRNDNVSIAIYDLFGRAVFLEEAHYPAGVHALEWSGSDFQGKKLGNGLYHFVMTSGNSSAISKAVVIGY